MTPSSAWTREEREAFSRDLESFCIPVPYLANEAEIPDPWSETKDLHIMTGFNDAGRKLWIAKRGGVVTRGFVPLNYD